MRLISRHILRSVAAPFLWALAALTGLLLLNQLAILIDRFGGKGLELRVILEAILLTIPALLALSLPMAVLVSTLYGYSQLAGDLELVAMYANGISVWRMARPALLAALTVATVNFFLYDQLVPRSNKRYSTLQDAVFRKTPTLTFQPHAINALPPPAGIILRADDIQSETGAMRAVTIWDLTAYGTTRVVHAATGRMAQSPNGTDLLLDLHDGEIDEYHLGETGRVQRTSFRNNQWRIADVASKLQIAANGGAPANDREMTGCELLDHSAEEGWNAGDMRQQIEADTRNALRTLLAMPVLPPRNARLPPKFPPHCGKAYRSFEGWFKRLVLPQAAAAQVPVPQQPPVPPPAAQQLPPQPQVGPPIAEQRDSTGQVIAPSPFLVPPPVQSPATLLGSRRELEGQLEALRFSELASVRYEVEYHKKFAIPLASICFVLLGIALALKYPRSGIGLVLGASMVIFLGFYILLIGGENIAKGGYLSPGVAIYGPLVLFTVLGTLAIAAADREMGSARSAGIWSGLRAMVDRWRGDRR